MANDMGMNPIRLKSNLDRVAFAHRPDRAAVQTPFLLADKKRPILYGLADGQILLEIFSRFSVEGLMPFPSAKPSYVDDFVVKTNV